MSDYIEREALINRVTQMAIDYFKDHSIKGRISGCATYEIGNEVQNMPTADVVEVRHGEWIKMSNNPDDGNYYCSECHNCIDIATGRETPIDRDFFYCPHCGAKMEKGESLRQ